MTIEHLKAHLNIVGNEDTVLLTDKLAAATAWIGDQVEATDINESAVQEATLQLAATFYEQREAIFAGGIDASPFTIWDLIEPYRARSF